MSIYNLDGILYTDLSDNLRQNGHFVIYKLPGGRINWLWQVPTSDMMAHGIVVKVDEQEIKELKQKAEDVWGTGHEISRLINNTKEPFKNYIYDRDPLDSYTSLSGLGIVTGDAAHTTAPHYGYATNMSI